jgi:hypothetical protein
MPTKAPVRCITCAKFTFKGAPKEWLDGGFGNCERREKFVMFRAAADRICEHHEPADAETVAKRDEWMKARMEK